MIKSVHLKNFQSHKDTILEFGPGVNAIIGPSDSGKSAVFRGIKWDATNRPLGDAFKSYWGGDTYVTITTDEGSVSRVKTKTKNYYMLNGSKLSAIGAKVPEEVERFLSLDKNSIQGQLEKPFLLDSSPGEVSQHFNKVAGLDIIDSSTKVIETMIKSLASEVEIKGALVEEYKTTLEQYADLPYLEKAVDSYEFVHNESVRKERQYDQLSCTVIDLQEIQESITKCTMMVEPETLLIQLESLTVQKQEIYHKIGVITDHIQTIERIRADIHECETLLEMQDDVERLTLIMEQRSQMDSDIHILKELIRDVAEIKTNIADQEVLVVQLQESWSDNLPSICPIYNEKCPLYDQKKGITTKGGKRTTAKGAPK